MIKILSHEKMVIFVSEYKKGEIITRLLGVTYEINTCVHKGSNKSSSIYFLTKQKLR